MRDVTQIASALYEQRQIVKGYSEDLAKQKEAEEGLRSELLEALKAARLKSVKVEEGAVFARGERVNYSIVDEMKALTWAKKNKCVAVNKAAANKILRTKYPNMPAGFEVTVTEYITVKGNNDSEE